MSLVVTGIQKNFKQRDVLNGVDLIVDKKEIHALVGVSGSGKSTLLRIIAGLETADTGTVTWDGEPLLGTPPHKRRITMLSQSPLLFPHLSVGENVTLATQNRSREQAEAWLARVRLPGRYDDDIHELSGGEQQRVSFARALAAEPRLILLDEPFTNLDPDLKYELQRLIRDLVQQLELTALLVTHDREEAMLVADRVTLLEDGEVLATGTPGELYETEPAFGDFIELSGSSYPATMMEVTEEAGEPVVLVRQLNRFGNRLGEYRLATGTYIILPRDEAFQVGETYYLRKKKGVV
ncbi:MULTISPECIES: ABC transporter ATP-binding protein [unclassified Exiguobacterium]|uniref:ABC transporter ATP-binding protein n=1 Tax=unclassified Exiguobacterium TaxID=2644629 RepID=UPI001039492C|nr:MULTISPECIES: ABC transporter ATP-binding protein [unclassified Exiguobacterium]TCI47613.1 ABC transporter ATP-binding protein [Exiguobacterium sp. SH5S32]TCI54498.1 ABC transporter ATP-binding protein [Exiguobacterium sp. SH1S4]TCI74290.1 ABC transporter ATP-binding protein [Exiguobacterium sp. SH1S1]